MLRHITRLALASTLMLIALVGTHSHDAVAHAGGCASGNIDRGPVSVETRWGAWVNMTSHSVQNFDCTVTPISVSIQQSSGNVYYYTDNPGTPEVATAETGSYILGTATTSPSCGGLPHASTGQWLTFYFNNPQSTTSSILSRVRVSAIQCSYSDLDSPAITAY